MKSIRDAARQLVIQMNPYDLKKYEGDHVEYWPSWAYKDYQLAIRALSLQKYSACLRLVKKGDVRNSRYDEFWLHVEGEAGRKASINITPGLKAALCRQVLNEALKEFLEDNPPTPAAPFLPAKPKRVVRFLGIARSKKGNFESPTMRLGPVKFRKSKS